MPHTSSALSADTDLNAVRDRAKVLARADRDMKDELIALRRELGLRQADVAALLGITPQAIQKFERYDADPKLSTVRRYANAVGALVEHRVSRDVGQSAVMAERSAWESGARWRTDLVPVPPTGRRDDDWSVIGQRTFDLAC